MSLNLSKEDQEIFIKLINSLQLQNIQFMDIHSRRSSLGPAPDPKQGEITISWNQQFADDDPLLPTDDAIIFRPRYNISTMQSGNVFFQTTMIVALQFSFLNKDDFNKSWEIEQIRKFFQEKQIMKTMWPIIRQQVIDTMTRHSLNPIPLPWII